MNAPVQSLESMSALGAGLCWRADDLVMTVWMKFDELGEYDAKGNLVNMTLGGCVTTLEKWRAFDGEWKRALNSELSHVPDGKRCFHMTDFEAWVPPFDFTLPNGQRDKERHNRFLNRLLDIMLGHIEGFHGFGAISQFAPGPPGTTSGGLTHHAMMNDCVNGAVKFTVLDVYDFYSEPLNLCFAKQEHIPADLIGRYLNVYNYGAAEGRIKTHSFGRPIDIYGLQGADLFAYEMGRAQRTGRPERYPFNRLVEGAKANGLRMTIYWGPIRSSTLVLSDARKPSKGPPS